MTLSRRLSALAAVSLVALSVPFAAFAQGAGKKADGPAQSAVAAKAEFATVPAADPSVKKATPASDLAAAKKLVGKTATLTGTVDKAFAPRGNGLVILNFAKDYKTAASAVVRAESFAKFPDLKKLEGKKVLVTGKVEDYKGQPEVVLTAPSQLKVVK